tara:strand:- start:1288 stop:1647 length:360 start_codon:yes stop_codon:yes gene_type:complete
MGIKMLFLTAGLLLVPVAAYPGQTAEILLDECQGGALKDEASPMRLVCAGYLIGMLDAASLFFQLNPTARLFCPPDGGSARQAMLVFKQYMDKHPEQLHLPASIIAMQSLKDAFPCVPE